MTRDEIMQAAYVSAISGAAIHLATRTDSEREVVMEVILEAGSDLAIGVADYFGAAHD